MRTRHKPLCIEEPVQHSICLPNFKSNQNWLLHPLLREKEPKNGKLHSYWNHSNVYLIPIMTVEASLLQLRRISRNENRGIQKVCIIRTSPNNKILKVSSSRVFILPMHFVDYHTTKVKYRYYPFKVLLERSHARSSSFGNFSHLPRIISCSQNHVY